MFLNKQSSNLIAVGNCTLIIEDSSDLSHLTGKGKKTLRGWTLVLRLLLRILTTKLLLQAAASLSSLYYDKDMLSSSFDKLLGCGRVEVMKLR